MSSVKSEKVWKVIPNVANDLIEQLLFNRGIKFKKEKELFFNPSLDNYVKDLEILGIKKAQKRIFNAIKNNEQITVYGDYDVDGICASAILYKALTQIGAKVLPYIPHREKEGYGLSKQGLEFVRDSGTSLVITVDNGIVALEQAKFAKDNGLDLIITDHHLPLDVRPVAYEIVHSIKMCGAAVAWCLIREIVTERQREELLQFVAIATVCDMMPLLGINRAFVSEGLKVINSSKRNLGLTELLKDAGFFEEVRSYEIGHIIGPRINAIGRLQHAIDALRLLCTKEIVKARKLAKMLGDSNLERQKLTIQAVDEARLLVSGDVKSKIHIVESKSWVPGIIGLVAARVCEDNYRPAIALSLGEVYAKGSARSVDGINIVEVIRSCSDILIDVGGHSGAAGFTIELEKIPEFKKRINQTLKNADEAVLTLEIESEVEVKKLTKDLAKEIEKLEPFGFKNPKPLLASRRLKVTDIRTLSEGKHLKFKAEGIDVIAFGMGEWGDILKNGQLIDLAYFLEINKFNGSENLQLKVKDLKIT